MIAVTGRPAQVPIDDCWMTRLEGRAAVQFLDGYSEEQALSWLREMGDSSRPLAGGTDAMMQYSRGELRPEAFVHIGRIKELALVEHSEGSRLGALTTHRQLARDPEVARRNPALAEAAATVGGWQTQAVGTIAGNICNASPAADTAPALLVADAVVHLRSSVADRIVPLERFFLGRRRVDRRPDELVVAVEVEPLDHNTSEVYLKVGRRGAMVVAVVGMAVRLTFDATGQIEGARLALCSMAPTPLRVPEAERSLLGVGPNDGVATAAAALASSVAPISDSRGSSTYRRKVLGGLLQRAVETCRSRVEGEWKESR